MTKMQLVETLAKKENLTLKAAESIINIIFDAMAETLIRGDRVEIRGFGSFMVKDYDGYRGHNPRTGASIEVAPKKLPFFKVGKDLKEMVDR